MRICDCSRKAVVRKRGEWICQRCWEMEDSAHVHKKSGVKDTEQSTMHKDWTTYWGDPTPIAGIGESLGRIAA